MTTTLAGGLHKAQKAVQNASSGSKKAVDLERDISDIHTKLPLTSDHGVRIPNTDQWLRVIGEDKNHSIGPTLLEDQLAREKVLLLH